jgi:hypothetical protein
MALDFTGYAAAAQNAIESAGSKPSNYTKLFGTPEYNFKENTKRDLNSSIDPLVQAAVMDVNDWDPSTVDFSKMKSAGTAYMDWKKGLSRPLNNRANNFARENNLDNFAAFKQMYDQQIGAYAPMVMNKLQNHQAINHLSDNQMRDMLGNHPGLQNLLTQTPQQVDAQGMPITPPTWVMPQQTWKQWADRKSSGGSGPPAVAAGLGALRAAQIGRGVFKEGTSEYMARRSPFGKPKALGLTKKGSLSAAKALGLKGVTPGASSKVVSSAQASATRAYNKAKKLYEQGKPKNPNAMSDYHLNKKTGKVTYRQGKGNVLNKHVKNLVNVKNVKTNQLKLNFKKTPKTPFDKTKEGIKLLKTKESKVIANTLNKKNLASTPVKAITKYVKKHGMSGLIKQVVKKAGVKGAAKLLGKGVLSLGLKGSGIGAAASIALDVSTIFMVYNLIKSEE